MLFKGQLYFFNLIFILYWSIVDLQCCVSGVHQSESVIHTHVSIIFQILFHDGLSQDTEYSSLCSTVGPCCSADVIAHICSPQPPTPPLPRPPPPWKQQVYISYF